MKDFFKRLMQIVEKEGFKNINDFALNGLKYDSSSKLSRLKDEKNKPSVEILEDIANKFENVDLHFLITGSVKYSNNDDNNILSENSSSYTLLKKSDLIESKNETISALKQLNNELINDKEFLKNLINNRLGKANAS